MGYQNPWLQTVEPNLAVENLLHSAITGSVSHITSFSLYPSINGFIERMVQTVNSLLKKSDGQDPYLALLSYLTTPIDSNLATLTEGLNWVNR